MHKATESVIIIFACVPARVYVAVAVGLFSRSFVRITLMRHIFPAFPYAAFVAGKRCCAEWNRAYKMRSRIFSFLISPRLVDNPRAHIWAIRYPSPVSRKFISTAIPSGDVFPFPFGCSIIEAFNKNYGNIRKIQSQWFMYIYESTGGLEHHFSLS